MVKINKRHYDFYNYNYFNKRCINLHIGFEFSCTFKGHKSFEIIFCGFSLESYLEHDEDLD